MNTRTNRIVAATLMCAAIVATIILPGAARAIRRSAEPDFAAIDAFLMSEMKAARIPGLALGIVQGDQIVHLKGFGNADPTGRPVTPQTPFILASTTKSFTALAIMQLVEAGKVELDAPVQRYLPFFRVADPDASARITVRQLLYHTSGIPTLASAEGLAGDFTLEQRVRALADDQLSQPVGTTFQYSNEDYVTLGLIIETVSGQSFEAYMQQHIFTPLAMRHSFLSETPAMQDGLATGYRTWFGLPIPLATPGHRGHPDGGIISSAEDMAHYLLAHLNEGRYGPTAVLSPAGIAELRRPAIATGAPDTAHGMGWFVGKTSGVTTISHDGGTPGFISYMALVPDGQWGVIILANSYTMLTVRMTIPRLSEGVIALLSGHQPPAAGLSVSKLYLIIDGILLALTALTIRSFLTLRHWRTQLERHRRQLVRGVIVPIVLNFVWAFMLLVGIVMLSGLPWSIWIGVQPDLSYWMLLVGLLVFASGIARLVLAFIVLRGAAPLRVADVRQTGS